MKDFLQHMAWYLLLAPLFAWIICGAEAITAKLFLQAVLIGAFTYPLVNGKTRKKLAVIVWKKHSSINN